MCVWTGVLPGNSVCQVIYVDGVASFLCLCGRGFTGEFCKSGNACRWRGAVLMSVPGNYVCFSK